MSGSRAIPAIISRTTTTREEHLRLSLPLPPHALRQLRNGRDRARPAKRISSFPSKIKLGFPVDVAPLKQQIVLSYFNVHTRMSIAYERETNLLFALQETYTHQLTSLLEKWSPGLS